MSYIGNSPTTQAFVTDQFSGTGSQTAFTMSVAPAATSAVLVAISGVLQDPSTYSVAGTTLTFSAAPPSGTGNISARYLGIPASGVATTAYRTLTEFTATSGQTTFSVPSYVAGFINVFRNGAMLGTADYTATNGTTVALAVGAVAGDLIAVESFYVSSVLNAIPNTAGAVQASNLAAGAARANFGAGTVLQVYSASQDTQIATTSQMNYNSSLPTISQGAQIFSTSFTPTSATSVLLFWFNTSATITVQSNITFALFEDSTCVSVSSPRYVTTGESGWACLVMFRKVAGSTSARTYSIRFGPQNAATAAVNTYPIYAGAPQTTFIIQEIAA